MFTTANLPESFRHTPQGRRALDAATRAGLRLVRHATGCPRDDSCICVLEAVKAVISEVQPPA